MATYDGLARTPLVSYRTPSYRTPTVPPPQMQEERLRLAKQENLCFENSDDEFEQKNAQQRERFKKSVMASAR